MADVRCPMCGKPNPADLDTCRFCQARLKPLAPPSEPPASSQQPDMPDWLRQLRSEGSGMSASGSAPASETPGEAEPPPPTEEVPDWLSRIRHRSSEDTRTGQPLEPEPEEPVVRPEQKVSDWLKSLPDEREPVASPPERVVPSSPPPPPAEPPASGPRAVGDMDQLREWLTSLEAQQDRDEESVTPASSRPLTPTETPTWLQPSQPSQPPRPTPQTPPQPANELPEWLRTAPQQPSPPAMPETPSETVPDWVRAFTVEPSQVEPPPAAEEIPDWLKAVSPTDTEQPGQPPSPAFTTSPETAAPSGIVPEWLAGLHPEQQSPVGTTTPARASQGDPLSTLARPVGEEELPDWVGEATPADENEGLAASGQETTEPAAEGLEPAQMPGWLHAMRPVEAFIPGKARPEDDQRLERSGPLAGLRGVLPIEDQPAQYRKPPAYSVKLNVTDKQRLNAALLENLLSSEAQPQTTGQERAVSSQRVRLVRLMVAFLLIVVVLIPLMTGARPLMDNSVYPADLVAVRDLIQSLPEGAPVLLAFEYEPALSGELRLAAGSVIEHLMLRQARLVIVSTIPAGPILGQDLLTVVQAHQPGYKLAERVTNLGYLPGGAASLFEFATRPQHAARFTLTGISKLQLAWNSTALRGVSDLSGFAVVVVLTDNADLGKAWIEQVQPSLGKTPLVMVASAQAAPLLQPYVESRQVKGMLTGLSGGLLYSRLLNRPNEAYSSAYQAGLLTAVALLVLGMALQGFTSLLALRRRKKRSEAQ